MALAMMMTMKVVEMKMVIIITFNRAMSKEDELIKIEKDMLPITTLWQMPIPEVHNY